MSDLILNPRTQRFVKIGGPSYRKAVKAGHIIPHSAVEQPAVEQPDPIQPPETDPRGGGRIGFAELPQAMSVSLTPTIEYDEARLQTKLSEMTANAIQTNFDQLANENLTDKQIDKLLKKMLFQKLCIDQPTRKEKKPKKTKSKTKKKRFKVITPPPSSSDQSESESD